MGVRLRRAGLPVLVEQREAIAARVAGAPLPGLRDEVHRRVAQVAERLDVLGAVDHDFVPLQRRVEVRHDTYVPAGWPVAEP